MNVKPTVQYTTVSKEVYSSGSADIAAASLLMQSFIACSYENFQSDFS